MNFFGSVPWYHFWNPESAGAGGMVFGLILGITIIVIVNIVAKIRRIK